jgi:hypothetical protein
MLAHQLQQTVREVIYRTQGSMSGPITRLMSPSDLGELIKPFVFLDRFEFAEQDAPTSMEHGWHPHSGIATVTCTQVPRRCAKRRRRFVASVSSCGPKARRATR